MSVLLSGQPVWVAGHAQIVELVAVVEFEDVGDNERGNANDDFVVVCCFRVRAFYHHRRQRR